MAKWILIVALAPLWAALTVLLLVLLFIGEIVGGDLADEAEREARKHDASY